jgi:pilus assembly protein Flp/PilA
MATLIGKKDVRSFLEQETGQDLVEYGLVAAVLALGCVAILKGVATNVATVFTSVATTLTTAL